MAVRAAFSLLCGCCGGESAKEPATQPGRLLSGSMAERFWGEHWAVECCECGWAFRCGADHPPTGGKVLCPNCGGELEPRPRRGKARARPDETSVLEVAVLEVRPGESDAFLCHPPPGPDCSLSRSLIFISARSLSNAS